MRCYIKHIELNFIKTLNYFEQENVGGSESYGFDIACPYL